MGIHRSNLAARVGAMAALSAGGVLVHGATGASDPPPVMNGQQMKRVEGGVSDISALDTSTRVAPVELKQSNDFFGVYRLSGGPYSGYFARVSGALTAVFPQSRYMGDAYGNVYPGIPAGTVFFIGKLPEAKAPAPTPGLLSAPISLAVSGQVTNQISNQVSNQVSTGPEAETPAPAASGALRTRDERASQSRGDVMTQKNDGTIAAWLASATTRLLTDDAYRGHRVAQLLAFAAAEPEAGAKPVATPGNAAVKDDEKPAAKVGEGSGAKVEQKTTDAGAPKDGAAPR